MIFSTIHFLLNSLSLSLHNNVLESLASDEHSSLLGPILSYEEKGFVKTAKGQYSQQLISS
jgi:hypothetical protein